MSGSIAGAQKIAARKAGVTFEAYVVALKGGLKWCWRCRVFHDEHLFGRDRTRYDGRGSSCLKARRTAKVSGLSLLAKVMGVHRGIRP